MNSTYTLIVFALLVAVYLFFRRSGQVAPRSVPDYLRNGAVILDVRSRAEFNAGHLPKAINLPLNEIESLVQRSVPDKSVVLLLHCQSGMRSGLAVKRLKRLGYSNAYNLGSYSRAARLTSGS